MSFIPTRTIVISTLAKKNSETALKALELGAIDVFEKPSMDVAQSLGVVSATIADKIRTVAQARLIPPVKFPSFSSGAGRAGVPEVRRSAVARELDRLWRKQLTRF